MGTTNIIYQLGNLRIRQVGDALRIFIGTDITDPVFSNDHHGLELAKEVIWDDLMDYV